MECGNHSWVEQIVVECENVGQLNDLIMLFIFNY